MPKALIKEIAYFAILFIILALLIHPDLLSHPLERIDSAIQSGNYFHPLLYTGIIFLILFIFRFLFKKIFSLLKKKQ